MRFECGVRYRRYGGVKCGGAGGAELIRGPKQVAHVIITVITRRLDNHAYMCTRCSKITYNLVNDFEK